MPTWIDFLTVGTLLTLYLYLFAIAGLFIFDNVSTAVSFSPVVTVFLTCLFAEINYKTGRLSSVSTVCVPVVIVCVIATVVALVMRRGREPKRANVIAELLVVALYVGVACSVCAFLLVKNLCGPSSFFQTHDNIQHLNLIRSFADSGVWSSLAPSPYLTDLDLASRPVSPTGFYPAAWNSLAALACTMAGFNDAAFIENVLNVVLTGIVYPISMCGFMRTLCDPIEENSWTWVAGALLTPAFAAFPWGFFVINPLYPNLLGLSLMPAALSLFLRLIEGLESDAVSRAQLICCFLLVPVSFASLSFAHPNTLFSAFVIMIPAIYGFGLRLTERLGKGSLLNKAAYTVLYVLVMTGVWYGLFKLPFLQLIVTMNHTWLSHVPLAESARALVGMQFLDFPSQWVLTPFVVAGIGSMLFCAKGGRHRFIIVSAMLCLVIYLACTVEDTGTLKHLIGGFWYTDHHRTSAMCVIPLVCIASFGLGFLLKCLHGAIQSLEGIEWLRTYSTQFVACLVAFVCVACGAYATRDESAWRFVAGKIDAHNNVVYKRHFGYDEQLFTEDVVDKIGSDALVINYPYDGSLYSYSVCGLRTMYRYDWNYLWDTESKESLVLREHLADYATSAEVQDAVEDLGAEYVILYDCGKDVAGTRAMPSPDKANWDGILAIDEKTDGFDVVMHEGDMYLLRIGEPA